VKTVAESKYVAKRIVQRIPLAKPVFDKEMERAALDAFRNEHFVLGDSVRKFEEEFARYCGVDHAVSMSSGTNALHIALLALGIVKGQNVVTTPASFVATSNAILHANLLPKFADIDLKTYCIAPAEIAAVADRKTKAVLPVHLYGYPADIDGIRDFSDKRKLWVIEDACQGYTARLNTVNAAIGRVQLKHLDEWNERRQKNAKLYDRLLSDISGLVLPPMGDKETKPVYHLYTIRIRNRDSLRDWLESQGVQCGVNYVLPIHLQPVYREMFGFTEGMFPRSEELCKTCLSIPMYPELTGKEIRLVSEKIHEFFENK
jgi:dTDP-4-amino-4,6-dideoxygalactose transaminase